MCDPKAHSTIGQELVTLPKACKSVSRASAGRKYGGRMLKVKRE
jgi:hypothetical protein